MDSEEITEALIEINSIHSSLNEHCVITYVILLEQNKDNLSDEQKQWIHEKIDSINRKDARNFQKNIKGIDLDIASLPITEKFEEYGSIAN